MQCIRSPRCKRNIHCGRAIPKGELLQTTRELGIAFVAYSPLGRGFLTGQFKKFEDLAADDYRRISPRFSGRKFSEESRPCGACRITGEGEALHFEPVALAWLLAQGKDIIPIPGTKRRKYLEENAGAHEFKADSGGSAADRGSGSKGCGGWPSLSGSRDGNGQPVELLDSRRSRNEIRVDFAERLKRLRHFIGAPLGYLPPVCRAAA